MHLLDEVPEHLLGDLEVGDHAVLERTDRLDRARGASQHALGLDPDRVNLTGPGVDRDHARLGQHDSSPPHVNEGVCGSQVDRHVATAETGQVRKEAHRQQR
jgi:hypothetical protein